MLYLGGKASADRGTERGTDGGDPFPSAFTMTDLPTNYCKSLVYSMFCLSLSLSLYVPVDAPCMKKYLDLVIEHDLSLQE